MGMKKSKIGLGIDGFGSMKRCKVEGCNEPHKARGFCNGHYKRWHDGVDLSLPLKKYLPRVKDRERICSQPNCDRKARTSGLCNAHHLRQLSGKDMDAPIRVYNNRKKRICTIKGCHKPIVSRDLCSAHYRRYLAGKDGEKLNAPAREYEYHHKHKPKICSIEGCERIVEARGLCPTHYRRQADGKDVEAPIKEHTIDKYRYADRHWREYIAKMFRN